MTPTQRQERLDFITRLVLGEFIPRTPLSEMSFPLQDPRRLYLTRQVEISVRKFRYLIPINEWQRLWHLAIGVGNGAGNAP